MTVYRTLPDLLAAEAPAKPSMVRLLRTTLDLLPVNVVITNADGRIIHTNTAAAAMLASGHPVRCRHGRLSAATPEATVALNARIAAAATNTFGVACRGTEVALPCPNGQVAVARVRPLGCNESGGDDGLNATAVIVMTEPGTLSAPLAALARHFELTPSETRVLEEVIWGKSRKQAAAALGVTDSTVKSHLEKLYAKTGTSGRSHLFQLVTNLSWPVTAGG